MSSTHGWFSNLEVDPYSILLQVRDWQGEVLKARFGSVPAHPRALLFILEGLALWSGRRLCVVISAEDSVNRSLGLGAEGEVWPQDNPLIDFLFAGRPGDWP